MRFFEKYWERFATADQGAGLLVFHEAERYTTLTRKGDELVSLPSIAGFKAVDAKVPAARISLLAAYSIETEIAQAWESSSASM